MTIEYKELLIGCGSRRTKDLWLGDIPWITDDDHKGWIPEYATELVLSRFCNVTTLDMEENHSPDILCDLRHLPFMPIDYTGEFEWWMNQEGCIANNLFDEIHAYEVLEHIGTQGDYQHFFGEFEELWRILKPGGFLFATCPAWWSIWAWGDPGHTRVISDASLVFLDQSQYTNQVGKTAMSDYRAYYKGNFQTVMARYTAPYGNPDANFQFILRAIK